MTHDSLRVFFGKRLIGKPPSRPGFIMCPVFFLIPALAPFERYRCISIKSLAKALLITGAHTFQATSHPSSIRRIVRGQGRQMQLWDHPSATDAKVGNLSDAFVTYGVCAWREASKK